MSQTSLEEDLKLITELEKGTWEINDHDVMDQLNQLQETYGRLEAYGGEVRKMVYSEDANSYSFDDKSTILAITQKRLQMSFYAVAKLIKRRVSFFSIYQHEDEIEMLKARHELLQKQCQNALE